jgi:hypothetical protein
VQVLLTLGGSRLYESRLVDATTKLGPLWLPFSHNASLGIRGVNASSPKSRLGSDFGELPQAAPDLCDAACCGPPQFDQFPSRQTQGTVWLQLRTVVVPPKKRRWIIGDTNDGYVALPRCGLPNCQLDEDLR